MTVWVLQQNLSPEEEARIEEHVDVVLPFAHFPSLHGYQHPHELRRVIGNLYPDLPPESVNNCAENMWHLYQIAPEDIVAVPLKARGEVALAMVSGRYAYELTAEGGGRHSVPVVWQARVSKQKFGKHYAMIFEQSSAPMFEISNAEDRTIIRNWLPNKYNRFARFKWLLVAFLIFEAIVFAMQGL